MSKLLELIKDKRTEKKEVFVLSEEYDLEKTIFYIEENKKFYKLKKEKEEATCIKCEEQEYSKRENGTLNCKNYLYKQKGKNYIKQYDCQIDSELKELKLTQREKLKILIEQEYLTITGEYVYELDYIIKK